MQHILDLFYTNLRQTKLGFVQKKLPVIRSLSGAFSTSGLGAKECGKQPGNAASISCLEKPLTLKRNKV